MTPADSESPGGSPRPQIIKEGRKVEESKPRLRHKTPWSPAGRTGENCHAWTDGSFRETAGLGWIITRDDKGAGPPITEGARNIGGQQTAFDAEVAAIEQVLAWFQKSVFSHITIHSDSTSAIVRAGHTGAGLG
jgi:hypothetical protein